MKAKELRSKDEKELKGRLLELHKELMREYAQIATGTIPKNPGRVRQARRTIARIKTILAQKEGSRKV